jgi:hypothetical protein
LLFEGCDPASQLIDFQLSVDGSGIPGDAGQHGALIRVDIRARCMRSIKNHGKAMDWIGGWYGKNRALEPRR